jgi:ABC-type phosphate transport system substrate-binding protein
VDEKIKQELPKFRLIYTRHPSLPASSGMGIKMLLDEQLSFSQSSRPFKDKEYEMAALRGVKLKQVPVAIDAIAVVVNPSLTIKGLTLEQLRGIYKGQITNWSKVGGPNLKITPYSPPVGSGATELVKENLLGGEDFGKNVLSTKVPTEALKKVGQSLQEEGDIGGIYMASASNLVGQCTVKPLPISRDDRSKFVAPYQGKLIPPDKCPKQRNKLNVKAIQNDEYPLTRRLFVIIKQNGQVDEQAGEAYAKLLTTDEGQKLIKEAGFIPIRSF